MILSHQQKTCIHFDFHSFYVLQWSMHAAYIFNICNNVTDAPSYCSKNTDGVVGPAYQLTSDGKTCFRLSNRLTDISWSLIDTSDPSKGVSMKYFGGDQCPGNASNPPVNRTMTINFGCSADQGMSNFVDTRVVESYCKYNINIANVNGCPNECAVSQTTRQLCAGNGFCGFDTDIKKPKCFCNNGFQGDDCSIATSNISNGPTTVQVILIICISILGVVVIAAAWLYYKVSIMIPRRQYLMSSMDDHQEENVFTAE
jgi:hypothetical protein